MPEDLKDRLIYSFSFDPTGKSGFIVFKKALPRERLLTIRGNE